MIANDVVGQLIAVLPSFTTQFNDTLAISSITSVATTATATTLTPHGLLTGSIITITGATAPIAIISFLRTNALAVIITAAPHDFTFSAREMASGFTQDVIVSGAIEPEFNGAFNLREVPNRSTLIVDIADSGATVATGSPIVENGNSASYNGTFNSTVTSTTTFEYPLEVTIGLPASGSPLLNSNFRIAGFITAERFYVELATKLEEGKLWAAVVIDDVIASKQRESRGDETAQYGGRGTYFRQELVQFMTIHVMQSMGQELSGRLPRDIIEQEVTPALFRSLIGQKFPAYFPSNDNKRLTFNNHSLTHYDNGMYVHSFNFEQNVQIVDSDIIVPDFSVALRDIMATFNSTLGTQARSIAVDTDEVPL